MTEPFRAYQRAVKANAAALAEGVSAQGGELLTGGTDTHLVQLDLRHSALSGKDMEERLHDVLITVNRNTVPFDERPPTIASGVRIGTPAATMRGLDEADAREVGSVIGEAISPDADLAALRARVAAVLARRPLYAGMAHGAPAGAGKG
jgi:glycine hydroxymethyltransferase